MRRAGVLARLALADARVAWRHTALALVVLTAAGATLALALVLRAQAEVPWQRAFDAAQGAHVVASASSAAPLEALAARAEVRASGGVTREAFGTMRVDGRVLLVRLVESGPVAPRVDRPLLATGGSVASRGVVIESTAAAALGLEVGDRIDIGPAALRPSGPPVLDGEAPAQALRVNGTARVVSQSPFPRSQPGLVLLSAAAMDAVTDGRPTGYTVGLRLRDPESAAVFAMQARAAGVELVGTWQDERDEALDGVSTQRAVLGSFALLLLLVAGAATATLVSARVVATARRTAMLRALGLAPREAQAVQVIQHAMIAVIAAGVGCTVAVLLAPRVTAVSAGLLGAGPRAPGVGTVLVVTTAVVAIAVGAALAATSRAASASTMSALRDTTNRRTFGAGTLNGFVARAGAGVPLLLGLGSIAARPGRTLLAAAGVALSVAAAVACAGMEATLAAEGTGVVLPGFLPAGGSEQLRPVAYTLLVLLAVLSLAGLSATTASRLAEIARDDATLAVLGVTPRQAVAQAWWAATTMSVAAAVAGLPIGYLLLRLSYTAANGSTDGLVPPAASAYLVVLGVAVVLVSTWTTAQSARGRSGPPGLRLRID